MAYWLCERRRDQESTSVMRFDPRFWTVNFPRPMMAAVTSTGPESMRVDAVFYNQDDLAGLIWDSEDQYDHPLIAYATNRDYRRLTLRFRWRSQGIMPLDAINGPTLTVEGRDAAGQPRAWYIRLWNYAAGSPEDAEITLKFSELQGGFILPGEADPLFAGDIDRLFISVVPPQFTGNAVPLPQMAEGWVEISGIRCDGAGVMLDTGDVMLPEHDVRMATGYDDAYNQTPARLLRQIRALGYRQIINHYVGMSHYFRLAHQYGGFYVTLSGGAINAACRKWHENFAGLAKAAGYELIFSLSYELFDAHCWNDWKQRAENGDPALTGWVPPSTLLSPAHDGAMGYLRNVATDFATILRVAGQPVRFQIGEPWWWVMPDGRICLYDDAARAEFGAALVSIGNISGPKDAAQIAMLDQAGALLAASTGALADTVRAAAGPGGATLYLLAYLPTILDPAAPHAQRANVPDGWASPAFDILQLEDYDWVISGNHGATRRAVAAVETRLGYPVSEQHYFAGFILNRDGRADWEQIEKAAGYGVERGTAEVFVWALPQVARDGYTHFSLMAGEEFMESFADVNFPLEIGSRAEGAAEFSTNIVTTFSGHERRNSDWADARLSFDVAPGVRDAAELSVLISFFRARRGPAVGFRFRDPFDHSSAGMTGVPEATDQPIGTGDGVRTIFPLVKSYDGGIENPPRRITRPVSGSVIVAVNGVTVTGWTVGTSGEIIFDEAPASGALVSAGYLFDVPVRFAGDRIDIGLFNFRAGEMPSVPLIEIREAV